MLDYFTEFIVKKKKDAKDITIIVLLLLAGLAFSYFAFPFVLLLQPFGQIIFLAIAAAWWAIVVLIINRSIEYEYIVTNGEIDVDQITARRKRKRLITVPSREIELIAPVSEQPSVFEGKVIDASVGKNTENLYFLLTTKDGVKTKILFNPSPKMLKIFLKFRPQNVKASDLDA